jgi:hypothetical protein
MFNYLNSVRVCREADIELACFEDIELAAGGGDD